MITSYYASAEDPLLLLNLNAVCMMTTLSGTNTICKEEIQIGRRPLNFGDRSVLGDTQVTHLNISGVVLPNEISGAPISVATINQVVTDPFNDRSWRRVPKRNRYYDVGGLSMWYQCVDSPAELVVTPTAGVTVLRTIRCTQAYWGYVSSPVYNAGWQPIGPQACYCLLCRDKYSRLYYYTVTKNITWYGKVLRIPKDSIVEPSQVTLLSMSYPSLKVVAPTKTWMTPGPIQLSIYPPVYDFNNLLRSCVRNMELEQQRIDKIAVDDARSAASESICAQAQSLGINGIAYVIDIVNLVLAIKNGDVDAVFRQALGAKGPLKRLQSLASAYLEGQYGLKLTIADTKELVHVIRKRIECTYPLRIARSSCHYSHAAGNAKFGVSMQIDEYYKCVYDPVIRGVKSFISALYEWDVMLSLENVWDLIPFSFVVDWFVPFGDMLASTDNNVFRQTLSIVDVMHTRKVSFQIPPGIVGFCLERGNASLMFTQYVRGLESTLPPIIPKFTGFKEFDNYLELGAIIIQKC